MSDINGRGSAGDVLKIGTMTKDMIKEMALIDIGIASLLEMMGTEMEAGLYEQMSSQFQSLMKVRMDMLISLSKPRYVAIMTGVGMDSACEILERLSDYLENGDGPLFGAIFQEGERMELYNLNSLDFDVFHLQTAVSELVRNIYHDLTGNEYTDQYDEQISVLLSVTEGGECEDIETGKE